MKSSRPPLVLMEQMVMVLVFALCAALCLQVFVKSDNMSRESEQRDRALIQVQNAAEVVRHCRGDMNAAAELLGYHYEQGVMYQEFDADWNPVDSGVYRLDAQGVPADVPGDPISWLEKAHVCVRKGFNYDQETEILFELEVAWQVTEVESDDGTVE